MARVIIDDNCGSIFVDIDRDDGADYTDCADWVIEDEPCVGCTRKGGRLVETEVDIGGAEAGPGGVGLGEGEAVLGVIFKGIDFRGFGCHGGSEGIASGTVRMCGV